MDMKIRKSSILLIGQLALIGLMGFCQQEAYAATKVTGPIVDSVASADGVMIYFETIGEGEPTLVFVHGWSCDRSYWKAQVGEFAKSYQVVTIDIGGHGESGFGREDWTMAAFGADVTAVVNKLNPTKVVLIGSSMGGAVIIQAAQQLTDRVVGLIGADTFKKFGTGWTSEQVSEITESFKTDFAASTDGFVRGMFLENADSVLVNWVVADMSSAPPEVAISAMENYFSYDYQAILKEVRVPICAINSDVSPTDLETNRAHAASFELKLMSDVGHFVMQEDPATFNRLLQEALDELTGKSGPPVDKK